MATNYLKAFALLLTLCFVYSCKCGDTTCPGLEPQYSAWLPYKAAEVITYTNGSAQEIHFTVNRYEISAAKKFDCSSDGYMGCHCPECPQPSTEAFAQTTDTSRKIIDAQGQLIKTFNGLYTNISRFPGKDNVLLKYTIFDHNNSIGIETPLKLNNKDSLLPSFTIGNRSYSNVIVHEADTSAGASAKVYFVWKSYYNKEFGVIAFHDLKTRTLYYRKS